MAVSKATRVEGVGVGGACYYNLTELAPTSTCPFHRCGNRVWERSRSLPRVQRGGTARTHSLVCPSLATFLETRWLQPEQSQPHPSLLTPSIKANFKVSWFLNEQP